MNNKTILIIIGSLAFIFVFLFAAYKLTSVTADYKEVMVLSNTDHVKWSPAKKHVLVEYSDFQCPACKNFNDLLNSFEASGSPNADIPKKVTFVFRHYPLYQIHDNAYQTAYAVEAASRQNKFFEMKDAVFKDQVLLTNTSNTAQFLADKAKSVGLNLEQFNKDKESKEVKNKVDTDLAGGERAGINQTPTFFLDGKKLEVQSIQEFIQILKNLD